MTDSNFLKYMLQKIQNKMKVIDYINKLYNCLKTDDLRIEIGIDLLQIIESEADIFLPSRIETIRQELTDELGYIIPFVNVTVNEKINPNQYEFYIRDEKYTSGTVYPNRYMVVADTINEKNIKFELDKIEDLDPVCCTDVFWITKEDAIKIHDDITCTDAADVIMTHFKEFVLEHVDTILTIKEVYKYVETVKSNYSKQVANTVLKRIDITELRRILSNLIKEKVSIKDIGYIFELLSDFGKYTQQSYTLSERIRASLSKKIMNNNIKKGVLYSLTLGESLESMLIETLQYTEFGPMFMLSPEQIGDFVAKVAKYLMENHKKCNYQPIIIADPKIRLALYGLLVRHIPSIVVISYSELTTDVEVNHLETIE